jgi:hypothetical protein
MSWLIILLACSDDSQRVRVAPDSDVEVVDSQTDSDSDSNVELGPCPVQMAEIDGFCIDKYEAWLMDQSPFEVPTSGVATTGNGQTPQGYISGTVAESACVAAGKRLCSLEEWTRACQGPTATTWPYGDTYDPDACNVSRDEHPIVSLFGSAANWSPEQMNDPQVNQQADTVDKGGANPQCVSADGVYDLHGNLHEWIADPDGQFKGGFYADASINGEGCGYRTTAHTFGYHDYSTGFRCCADAAPLD